VGGSVVSATPTRAGADIVRSIRRLADRLGVPVLVVDLDDFARYGRRRPRRYVVRDGAEWHLYELRWVGRLEPQGERGKH
jgi:hypothetical protein